jgi:hypothetical protein
VEDALGEQLQQMMIWSPDEVVAHMKHAMKLMTDGDVLKQIVHRKDEVIKTLESSSVFPKEELERYKADPAYFEQQMRESFSETAKLCNDPEYWTKIAAVIRRALEAKGESLLVA